MKVIIACAGTGGHINPGIAIANKIKAEEKTSEILFLGTERGLEKDLVPRAGYALKTIDAYGLSTKISFDNLKKLIKTIKGFSEAKKIVKEFKPDVVIGTGGYICGAAITAANKLKIPCLLHESNAFPGKAIKMLASKTNAILVSFEEAKNRIPKAKSIVLTGTPTRKLPRPLNLAEKIKLKERYQLNPAKPTILVFGGSQGAKAINDTIIDLAVKKLNRNYQILLASGQKQYEVMKEELKKCHLQIEHLDGIHIVPYIYELQEAMEASDMIVSRAGAITVTEIANIGKPSILVPLPNVSHNHQQYNAEVLENVGAAKIILNEELNANRLHVEITEILEKGIMEKMGAAAKTIAINDVEEKIYQEIKKIVKG